MNLVKCEKGHYYDSDKFDTCPHCAGNVVGMGTANSDMTISSELPSSSFENYAEITSGPTEPLTGGLKMGDKKITVSAEEKTIGIYFGEAKKEPVVGWLVCVDGPTQGESYVLKSGKNFIGRNETNDVVLQKDLAVSREKHAIIVYDPKSRRFLAQPGMSSELFYMNDEVVLQAMPLSERSVIQIGKSKLLFIPLCGGEFDWESYKDNTFTCTIEE